MLKKRLIFTLLIEQEEFQLSRNFVLQSVGNLEWLYENYNLKAITESIDELVLLNVERGERDIDRFSNHIKSIVQKCFMPIAVGGGLRSLEHAYQVFSAGADKLVVNTPLFTQPEYVSELVRIFGSQSIVGSIDYKHTDDGTIIFVENGKMALSMSLEEAVLHAQKLNVGELYLTCINNDGTGQGLDIATLSKVALITTVPIIASGGVGNYDHLAQGLEVPLVTAVSTANIFNFIGDGLISARNYLKNKGIPIAEWDINILNTSY